MIGFALSLSAFLLMTDNVSPFTTQATFYKSVVNIAPEVSGNITHVYVVNGQYVNANQPLFSIDEKPYQIAVAQAQAELQQAKEADAGAWQQHNKWCYRKKHRGKIRKINWSATKH